MASAESPPPDDDGGITSGVVRGIVRDLVPNIVKDIVPNWVWTLATVSISVGGARFYLVDEPVAFIRAVFADGIISGVQLIVGTIASTLLGGLDVVVGTGSSVGLSLLGATGAVGDSIVFVIDTLNGVAQTLIVAAGPLSPLVVVLIYGGTIVGTAAAVRAGLALLGWAP